MNQKELKQFYDLVTVAVEGSITSEQFETFKTILQQDPEAVKYYSDYISLLTVFRSSDLLKSDCASTECELDMSFWSEMAHDEKTAPAIEIDKPENDSEIHIVNNSNRATHQISKPLLFTAIISSAALMLLLFYVNFILPPPSKEVATLIGSDNAEWSEMDSTIDIGTRLRDNQGSLWLKKGLVEIEFDYGARVLIQGPANFELETPEELFLHSGRLYAKVPSSAIGFTVHTPTSSILDLGTEFGVKVDMNMNSDIHVFKGKTSLMLGARGSTRSSQIMTENHALRVQSNDLKVSEIDLDEQVFETRLPSPYQKAVFKSKPHAYWRFEDNLSGLAMNSVNKMQYNASYVGNCSLEKTGPDLGDDQSNKALVLDGLGGHVTIPNPVSRQKLTDSYSIAMWVRPDVISNQNIIVNTDSTEGSDVHFSQQLRMTSNGCFEHYTYRLPDPQSLLHDNPKESGSRITGETFVEAGKWYHVVITADKEGMMRLFVNGREDAGPLKTESTKDYYDQIAIGTQSGIDNGAVNNRMNAFVGAIDEVSYYYRELTRYEIERLYFSVKQQILE